MKVQHYFTYAGPPAAGDTAICGFVARIGRADGHADGRCADCTAILRQRTPRTLSGAAARRGNPRRVQR